MIHDSQIAGYGDDMVKRICSRCQTHNAASSGQFDLLVRSVRLGEDEEYECQVLPGPMAPIKVPLRASVHIEIQGEREREGAKKNVLGSKLPKAAKTSVNGVQFRIRMNLVNAPPDEPTIQQ